MQRQSSYTPNDSPTVQKHAVKDIEGWKVCAFCAEIPDLEIFIFIEQRSWKYFPITRTCFSVDDPLFELALYALQNWFVANEQLCLDPDDRQAVLAEIDVVVRENRIKKPLAPYLWHIDFVLENVGLQTAHDCCRRLHAQAIYKTVGFVELAPGRWHLWCLMRAPTGDRAECLARGALPRGWVAAYAGRYDFALAEG